MTQTNSKCVFRNSWCRSPKHQDLLQGPFQAECISATPNGWQDIFQVSKNLLIIIIVCQSTVEEKAKKKLCTFPKMILSVNPIPHPLLFMAFCPPWLVEEVLSLRQNLGDRGIRDRWAVLSYKYIPNIAVRMLPANRTGLTFLQSHSL